LFHNLPNTVPNSRNEAKFSQIYVIGNNDYKEAALRNHKSGARIDSNLLLRIQQFLSSNNSYAKFYRTVNEELAKNPVATFVLKALNKPNLDQNTYNHPRVDEVAMVLECDNPNKIEARDVVLRGSCNRSFSRLFGSSFSDFFSSW
jgi:hypothetical protein